MYETLRIMRTLNGQVTVLVPGAKYRAVVVDRADRKNRKTCRLQYSGPSGDSEEMFTLIEGQAIGNFDIERLDLDV